MEYSYQEKQINIKKICLFVSFLFRFISAGIYLEGNGQEKPGRILVETMPWLTDYDIIDGWDWSLKPGIQPVTFSGTIMPRPLVDGKRYDLPGNEYTRVTATWRELEPEEGLFNFEPLRRKIFEAARSWVGVRFSNNSF